MREPEGHLRRLAGPAPAMGRRLAWAWPARADVAALGRRLLFRLHWLFGLTAGLVLGLMGLTGALMSYEDAVMARLNADHAVQAGNRVPLGPRALLAAWSPEGAGRVETITYRGAPIEVARLRFRPGPGGAGRDVSLDLDPYTGQVRGPVRGEATFATIRRLHRWLLLPGDGKGWGRTITCTCVLGLLALLASGIYLRWPKPHRWRIWLKPSLARPGRARWWSLHAVTGTWALPVYLVIVLSGLWWSSEWYQQGARWLLTGTSVAARGPKGAPAPPSGPALEAAWAAFRADEGRNADLASVRPPGEAGQPIRIRYRAAGSGEATAQDEVTYDGASGQRLASRQGADAPLGQRIAADMLEVHRGRFFGWPVALLFCVAALAMPVLTLSGVTLYALRRLGGRRRARAPRAAARPAP